MAIRVKRVYQAPSPDDGTRYLVDRLWPRGLKREEARLDGWLRNVGPSDGLRRWFGHDPTRWEQFQARYFAELRAEPEGLRELRAAAAKGTVTLLYSARDPEHNQAVALRAFLLQKRR